MIAFRHSSGTCRSLSEALNKLTRGPTTLIGISQPFQLMLWLAIALATVTWHVRKSLHESLSLRCPETLFISHEDANFLFSVFRVVHGETKTPKIMGCCRANFTFLHALKIGTFRGKWTFEWVIKTSHFVRLPLYFLIISKLAFCIIACQRCLAGTANNVWVRAQNSAKNNFLSLRLETYLAWTFLFLYSFLNNYPRDIWKKNRFSTNYEYKEWG